MKAELVQTLTTTFEAHAQQAEGGVEYWLARDLQHLLGYDEWRNFTTAISKAKTACEVSGHRASDHFVGVNKMVDLGSGKEGPEEPGRLAIGGVIIMAQKRPNPTHKDSLIVRQRDLARDLEQTIAGSLPLPAGEDRAEGAQRVVQILSA